MPADHGTPNTGDERDREVEAVARVFADLDGYEGSRYVPVEYFGPAKKAIAALDAARSTQGEDHETGRWVQPEAFCEQPTCQAKNDGHCHVPENCGHFQPKERWEAAPSPSRDGTVAVEDVERLQTAIDKAYGAMNASAYVGGPSEREAWQTALTALGEVVTQHKGQGEFGVSERTERIHDQPTKEKGR